MASEKQWVASLLDRLRDGLPARLIRHGAYFDFMTVWAAEGDRA